MSDSEDPLRPSRESAAAITVLGDSLPYADGAEAQLLELMRACSDTSAGSDELARLVHDWPTQYHLSAARANLILPLRLGPGKKALDVGCGTGALLRAIAESGAEAYGIEGSYDRCLVAAERVRGMPNARVMCGALDRYLEQRPEDAPEEFDIIVVCGVLEYTDSDSGGAGGPKRFLEQLSRLLAPGGVIALAMENQWGLKYLLSYPEDHLDLPFVGVEGYWRSTREVRTWSKERLDTMIAGAGLQTAAWYAALPDFKLPSVLVRQELLDAEDGRALVKQFVRSPMSRPGAAVVDADPVLTFQAAVDSGLAMQTANSFLVMATHRGDDAGVEHVRDGLLWLSTSERTRRWRSVRRLCRGEGGAWELQLTAGASAESGALRCIRAPSEPVVIGDNAEDLMRRAYVHRGLDSPQLADLLQRWALEAQAHLQAEGDGAAPFDVMPNNFIVDSAGDWAMVDTEFSWRAQEPEEVYLFRSLWYTADRLADAGVVPGVDMGTSRLALTLELAQRAGLPYREEVFHEWVAFESELATELLNWSDDQRAAFPRKAQKARDAPLLTYGRPVMLNQSRVALKEGLDRVQAALEETREQLMITNRELARQRLLLELAHEQVHLLRGRFKEMEASQSWRVTAPLRRARRGGRS